MTVLGGKHDLGGFHRLAARITQRHLALGIRLQRRLLAGMARIGQQFQDFMAVIERRRHQRQVSRQRMAEHRMP